jgi:hypothetical protein
MDPGSLFYRKLFQKLTAWELSFTYSNNDIQAIMPMVESVCAIFEKQNTMPTIVSQGVTRYFFCIPGTWDEINAVSQIQ